MSKLHERLYEEVKEAIQRVFGDTSVPKETTWETLQTLKSDIEVMIESMDVNVE